MATSLPDLCEDGGLEEVRAALARGEEVNQTDDAGGYTGLILAVENGHEEVVELLLQQPGLDVNLADGEYHLTALHRACGQGHPGIVRRLLAHPSLTCHNAGDIYGRTPLMTAVAWNRVECVRELVAVEEVDLETTDSEGRSLEEVAREEGRGLEAWQVVREELGRREERRRAAAATDENRTLSAEEIMAKYTGVMEKHSKQKKVLLKKKKAEEAREKIMKAAEAQRVKVESIQENIKKENEEKLKLVETFKIATANIEKTKEALQVELNVELGKLESLMEEGSSEDRREGIECPVCCEEMTPPKTIFQCSQGHPVCSSCRPRLQVDRCPTCREAFMGRNRGLEQLVQDILNKETEE